MGYRPISKLLSGRFRDEVPLYINTGTDLLDKSACKEWAQGLKESPEGWHTIKLGFEGILRHKSPSRELHPGRPSQMMTATELNLVRQGFENCREALGNDIDFIVHIILHSPFNSEEATFQVYRRQQNGTD
jgi:L-alanine-DL-glutamate epimerase-like enolase superfamily enzyme